MSSLVSLVFTFHAPLNTPLSACHLAWRPTSDPLRPGSSYQLIYSHLYFEQCLLRVGHHADTWVTKPHKHDPSCT